jgi:hypothetical protein
MYPEVNLHQSHFVHHIPRLGLQRSNKPTCSRLLGRDFIAKQFVPQRKKVSFSSKPHGGSSG